MSPPRCGRVISSASRCRPPDCAPAPAPCPTASRGALTLAPIVPAAVHADGRFGALIGSWAVRFGPLVTLDDPYDADDPLAAARFTDAMRRAVAALLEEL